MNIKDKYLEEWYIDNNNKLIPYRPTPNYNPEIKRYKYFQILDYFCVNNTWYRRYKIITNNPNIVKIDENLLPSLSYKFKVQISLIK